MTETELIALKIELIALKIGELERKVFLSGIDSDKMLERIQTLETQIETQRDLLIKAADLMDKNAQVLAGQGQALLAMGELADRIKTVVVP